MKSHLQVHWWDGSLVGHLVHRGTLYFIYDEGWIKQGHNLSPLYLPFTTAAFNGVKLLDGLPGLISDCLPDVWGRKVARKLFTQNQWGEPSVLSLLQWRGDRGLGVLQFMPPLKGSEGKLGQRLQKIHASVLARNAEEIERGEPSEVLPQLAQGGTAGGMHYYTQGFLDRGMLIDGEVWPPFKKVEALCIDAGVASHDVRMLFDAVSVATAQWSDFARQAHVSSAMTEEIRNRHERIRSQVLRAFVSAN